MAIAASSSSWGVSGVCFTVLMKPLGNLCSLGFLLHKYILNYAHAAGQSCEGYRPGGVYVIWVTVPDIDYKPDWGILLNNTGVAGLVHPASEVLIFVEVFDDSLVWNKFCGTLLRLQVMMSIVTYVWLGARYTI